MTEDNQKQQGKTLWNIAGQLRGAMNADDFRDYMLAFLRCLADLGGQGCPVDGPSRRDTLRGHRRGQLQQRFPAPAAWTG